MAQVKTISGIDSAQIGQLGSKYAAAGVHDGDWCAIQAIGTVNLDVSLVSSETSGDPPKKFMEGTLNNLILTPGTKLWGRWSKVTVNAGVGVLYKADPNL